MKRGNAVTKRNWGELTWRLRLIAVAALTVVLVGKSELRAADELSETALALAPQDSSFLSTNVNMDAAWEEFVNGPFVSNVRSMPYVQKLQEQVLTQWDAGDGQVGQAKMWIRSPNVQNLLKLASEMFSDEAFVYGGADWSQSLRGMMRLQNEMMQSMNRGPEAFESYVNQLSSDDIADIQVPTTVIGFRIKDEENAKLQLDALEGIIRLAGSQIEQALPLLQRLVRTELDDGQTLAITLDASLIPVEELNGDERQAAEKAQALLEGRSLAFAIGIRSGMLLIVFSEDADVINNIGTSSDSLLGLPELDVIESVDVSGLRSISYVSGEFMKSQWEANFDRYFSNVTSQFTMVMANEGDKIPGVEKWVSEIKEDAAWLDEKLAAITQDFGPMVSWSQAVEGGLEGFTHNWTKSSVWANAHPMAVLNHAGSDPLFYAAFKQQQNEVGDEMLDYIIEKAPSHIEKLISVMETDPEEREVSLKVLERATPLVKKVLAIFRGKISDGLSANESMIAFDADWAIGQLPNLPPSEEPLPLPELAFACVVSDRALLIEGFTELYEVFDEVTEFVREMDSSAVPPGYTVPRPKQEEIGDAIRYSYDEIAQAVPVEGLNPQVIISDEVLLFGYSDRQLASMVEAQELAVGPSWLENTPAAAVSYIDFASGFQQMRPWVRFGLQLGLQSSGRSLEMPVAEGDGPIPTGNDILDLWDCFQASGQSAATVTITEDGSQVSHWLWTSN